jgi:hypothetical protein
MSARLALVWAGLLLAVDAPPDDGDGVWLPEQVRGAVTARLAVKVARQPEKPHHAELTLTVEVQGPGGLEVRPPELTDPQSAWEDRRAEPAIAINGHRIWRQVIRLRQTKPGVVPPPALSVRFRAKPDAEWERAEWTNVLRESRHLGAPEEPPAPTTPAGPRWWLWAGLALGGLGLAVGTWGLRRRLTAAPPPLTPDRRALRELTAAEQDLAAGGDAETFATRLAAAVRHYLAERFELPDLQQTTAEFLGSVGQVPQFPAARQELLRDFLERCDLAKFARADTSAEECRQLAEMARTLVGSP